LHLNTRKWRLFQEALHANPGMSSAHAYRIRFTNSWQCLSSLLIFLSSFDSYGTIRELHLQIKLIELQSLLAQAQHEPRLKGPFPVDMYRQILISLQTILDKLHSMRCVTTREEWWVENAVPQELMLTTVIDSHRYTVSPPRHRLRHLIVDRAYRAFGKILSYR